MGYSSTSGWNQPWGSPTPVEVEPGSSAGWSVLPIGAGGWITRLDIALDGAMVARTDTYGAYIRSGPTQSWTQVVSTDSMPSGHHGFDSNLDLIGASGVYEIVFAPTNSQILYMLYNGKAYKSTNFGTDWSYLSNYSTTTFDSDGGNGFRMNGPHMAVSPSNPDHVIAVTPLTVRFSTDGGATWGSVAGVTAPTSDAGGMVVFDPNNANNVYIATDGNGVYQSTAGIGGPFAITSGGPTTFQGLDHDVHGRLWASTRAAAPNVSKFQAGAWSATSGWANPNGGQCVISDPSNSSKIYILITSGDFTFSTNGGSSWTEFLGVTRAAGAGQPGWHAVTSESFMSASNVEIYSGNVYFAQGIGVWRVALASIAPSMVWNADSIGIEQLVVNKIISPPGGDPIVACWDRPVFKVDGTSYPSGHGPDYSQAIRDCFGIDWASSSPSTIAGFVVVGEQKIIVSSDYGSTWAEKTLPGTANRGGGFAAASSTNFIYVTVLSDARLRYTTDAGDNWTLATMTGIPTSGETGWGNGIFMHRHPLCADRVAANTFYAYNNGAIGNNSFAGFWRSTNSGATWAQRYPGWAPVEASPPANLYNLNSFNSQLEAAPDNEGHLFYTCGDVGGSPGNELQGDFIRSTDGGANWSAVPNVKEVKHFGFGKAQGGVNTYPAIYIVGWVSSVFGVWRCVNGHQALASWTWTRIDGTSDGFPLARADTVTAVSGDSNTYGKCYIGYRGSGALQLIP